MTVHWQKLGLIATAVFERGRHDQELETFLREWKADKTVAVRKYPRTVRAGGESINVTAIVVRRKA